MRLHKVDFKPILTFMYKTLYEIDIVKSWSRRHVTNRFLMDQASVVEHWKTEKKERFPQWRRFVSDNDLQCTSFHNPTDKQYPLYYHSDYR